MKYTITEHNAETNEIVKRDMTLEEIKSYEKVQESMNDFIKISDEKIKARASALTKLKALGLSEDEIAAL